jgi:hypothetical protein
MTDDAGGTDKGSAPVQRAVSFFTTLPGIMTAVAALLTAVVGLLVFLRGNDGDGPPDRFWVEQANRACIRVAEALEAANTTRLQLTPEGLPDWSARNANYSEALDQLVEDFKQLPSPAGQEEKVSDIIELWRQSSDRFLAASFAEGDGRVPHEEAGFRVLLRGGDLAASLGAVACRDVA